MSTVVSKDFTFDAAHRLLRHDGKCRRLHGHTYGLSVVIAGDIEKDPTQPDYGMVLDFGRLKDWWKSIEGSYDHVTILEEDDVLVDLLVEADQIVTIMEVAPTAENLAANFRASLEDWLSRMVSSATSVRAVRVRETPTSWAES